MYRTMMTIDGIEVPSSCVKVGTKGQCEEAAKRLMRAKERDKRIGWIVLPTIQA